MLRNVLLGLIYLAIIILGLLTLIAFKVGFAITVAPYIRSFSEFIGREFGTAGLSAVMIGFFSFLIYINIQGRNGDDRKQVAETGILDIQRNVSNLSRAERWRTLTLLLAPLAILALVVTLLVQTGTFPK